MEGNLNMPVALPFWEKDARYRYYLHGPLARTEMGDIGVQGIDYAYTLQGWIKGVNSDALDPAHDLGQDGAASTANHLFARDAFGYSLGYYNGDFTPIGSSSFVATTAGSELNAARNDLFNGNIGSMVTSLYAPVGSTCGSTTGAHLTQGPIITTSSTASARPFNQLNL